MNHVNNSFIYNPGGENEAAGSAAENKDDQNENVDSSPKTESKVGEKKTVIEKAREVLQDWANKDERDNEYDDERV